MQVKWTENQKKAIDKRGCNILVSAAAGSGKTAVLVERVQNMISNHELDISRLLITTFTNAAASEMRQRILETLTKKLEENNKDQYLQQQLALFERANIGTIHSFCQILLRNHFHEIGLSANFKIADDMDTSLLKKQALEFILEEKYLEADSSFLELVDSYGGKKDDSLIGEMIFKIYDFARSTPNPKGWLLDCKSKFENKHTSENEFLSDGWGGAYIKAQESELAGMVEEYELIMDLTCEYEGFEKYTPMLEKELNELKLLYSYSKNPDWDKMYKALHNISFDRLPSKSKDADSEIGDIIKGKRKKIKDRLNVWIKDVFYAESKEVCKDIELLSIPMDALCDLIIAFDDAFSKLKREKNLVDFSDLEQFTILLLNKNSDIVKEKFDQILIDEYQDTNAAQAQIFESISRGDNSFVVGDVKQSIYRFRNAQPQLFLEKASNYEINQTGENIYLANNFRSSKGIIDIANFIFERIMSSQVGEVSYNDNEKLIYSGGGGEYQGKSVELHIIEKKMEEDSELQDDELQIDATTREAQLVARRIVRLVEIEKPLIYDKKLAESRQISYGDITVLMRKTSVNSNILATEMAQLGVPVYSEDNGSYFASIEITTILSLLRVLDNPLQDVALVAVLRSPLLQFCDDELALLRGKDKKKKIYDMLKDSDSEKCKRAVIWLENYKEKAKYMGLAELIRYILSDTGYETFVCTMPNSEIRLMNLRLLIERAGKFESDGYKSLYDFIQYVTSMIESGSSFSMAKVISENENAVRIMSIHKSKGLEFPVVFLVNCGSKFNLRDVSERVLFDLKLGIGADLVDAERRVKYNNISKQAIASKKKLEMLSEEMRILYVALTRPINMLFIFGSVNNIAKAEEKWNSAIFKDGCAAAYHISQQNTLLDWICIGTRDMPKSMMLETEYHYAYEIIKDGRTEKVFDYKIKEDQLDKIDSEYYEEIEKHFSYKYKWQGENIPSKLSVSEIIHKKNKKIQLSTPKFIKASKEVSGAFRGTVIHFIMQNLNIYETDTFEQIKNQIFDMAARGLISDELIEIIDIEAIYQFFASDLGLRLKKASVMHREVKFLVEFKASEILPEYEKVDEKILVQGVVDCYFEEEDGIIILDFKTGKSKGNDQEYNEQLRIYERCLGEFLKKKIKGSFICYL